MNCCLKLTREFQTVFVNDTAGNRRKVVPHTDRLLRFADVQIIFTRRHCVKGKIQIGVVIVIDIEFRRKRGPLRGNVVILFPCVKGEAHRTDVVRPRRTADGQSVKRCVDGKTEAGRFSCSDLQSFLVFVRVEQIAPGRSVVFDSRGKCFGIGFGDDGRDRIGDRCIIRSAVSRIARSKPCGKQCKTT